MSRRRAPLVCQYVENFSSAALEQHADIIREIVGRQHGVYALYRRDKLYYVGLTINLRGRLNSHLKDRHRGLWDRFSIYLTIEDRHLRELESLVVRIAKPKGNRQTGKFARSENLMRMIRRRVKEKQRAEWLELIGREMELIAAEDDEVSKGGAKKPALAGYVERAMSLRAKYKGKIHKARVRKNGTIRVKRRTFNSPSLAAQAVVGRPCNGWGFWTYERAPGKWVRLRELRRR